MGKRPIVPSVLLGTSQEEALVLVVLSYSVEITDVTAVNRFKWRTSFRLANLIAMMRGSNQLHGLRMRFMFWETLHISQVTIPKINRACGAVRGVAK